MPITLFKMRLKLYMLVTLGFLLKIRLQLWCQYDLYTCIYGGTCIHRCRTSLVAKNFFFRTVGIPPPISS